MQEELYPQLSDDPWANVHFQAVLPGTVPQQPTTQLSVYEDAFEDAQRLLAEYFALRYKTTSPAPEAATETLRTWNNLREMQAYYAKLQDQRFEFKGDDLIRLLAQAGYSPSAFESDKQKFLTDVAAQLTPAERAAVVGGSDALSQYAGVTKNALSVVAEMIAKGAWLVVPALFSLLQLYLTGSVATLASVLPSLLAANWQAIKTIAAKLADVAANALKIGLDRLILCIVLLFSTAAVALLIGFKMWDGANTVATVVGLAVPYVIALGLASISSYLAGRAQSNIEALIKASTLREDVKSILRGVSTVTLTAIAVSTPAVASFMLYQYAPTLSEDVRQEVLNTFQSIKPMLKVEVPLDQPLVGSAMTPLELDSRLTWLGKETLVSQPQTRLAQASFTEQAFSRPQTQLAAQQPVTLSEAGFSRPQTRLAPAEPVMLSEPGMSRPQTRVAQTEYSLLQDEQLKSYKTPMNMLRDLMAARDLSNIEWAWYLKAMAFYTVAALGSGVAMM